MRLKSNDTIFGIEAKKLRDVFKACPHNHLNRVFFREALKISKKKSDEILNEMIKERYFAQTKYDKDELQFLIKGNAIRNAKFIKPITKKVAQKYIDELIERAKKMNNDEYYIMYVDEIYAFGSFITNSPDCQDIDLYIALKMKEHISDEEASKLSYKRVPDGKTILEQAAWASVIEPNKFLRSKNKYLSFHDQADAENASNGNLKLIWKKSP